MADPEIIETDELPPEDLTEEEEATPPDDGADDEGAPPAEAPETPPAEEELVLTLDGAAVDEEEAPPEGASPKAAAAFAAMRTEKKRLERELRELKAKQEEAAARTVAPVIEPLGAEPTLEECDFDAETFATKLKAHLAKKAEHEARQREAEAEQRKQAEAWQQRLTTYKQEADKLKRPDFEDAESAVKVTFNTVQQGLLLKHPKAAALVYVLGKNPARAKTLAAIADPVDFAYAAAELAGQVKVERKSPPPPTDTPVRGSTTGSALASQSLEALKEKGRRTGDYSAYFAAKRAADARK